jgi:hypothetical protein
MGARAAIRQGLWRVLREMGDGVMAKRMMRAGMMLGALAVLAACTGKPSLEDASLSTRELELEEFFDGRLVAYGQFQDIFGTVRRQFVVNIQGDWDG